MKQFIRKKKPIEEELILNEVGVYPCKQKYIKKRVKMTEEEHEQVKLMLKHIISNSSKITPVDLDWAKNTSASYKKYGKLNQVQCDLLLLVFRRCE